MSDKSQFEDLQRSGHRDIDLFNMIRVLWAGKWLIAAITAGTVVLAILLAFLLPVTYKADALLAPNQNDTTGNLAGLGSQYAGLASLAGIDISSDGREKTVLGLELLQSRKFIGDFVDRRGILVPLMAVSGWDSQTGELEIDDRLYDTETDTWLRRANPPRGAAPSMQEAYEFFIDDVIEVSQDAKTEFITISVKHRSPFVAKTWVDWLVEDINDTVMQQDVEEAEQAIEYLTQQMAATSLAELQGVFSRLIEEQTKTIMLAKMSPEYLFRTIDPAVVPEYRWSPRRTLIAALGILLGLILGVVTAFLRASYREFKNL
jgi:uncharacterized protein involved in exopolysaccharide biosynthesis